MPKKKYWKAKRIDGFQPVMIDIEVHKAIEAARESFTETPNAILRRMLRLEGARSPKGKDARKNRTDVEAVTEGQVQSAPDEGGELPLPDGSELRAAYRGVTVTGLVQGGAWEVEGSRFTLPSAKLVASLDGGGGAAGLSDWRNWEILLPGAEGWQPLENLAKAPGGDAGLLRASADSTGATASAPAMDGERLPEGRRRA